MQINDTLWQLIDKQVGKNSRNEKFLFGPADILQSNRNSNFQENALKEYY